MFRYVIRLNYAHLEQEELMKRKSLLAFALTASLCLTTLSACGQKNEQAKTKAEPDKQKKVMLYSSLKEKQLSAIKEALMKHYPDRAMDYYAAGTGKVLTKIATEQQSGQIASDLIWVGDPSNYLTFKEKGMLEAYQSKEAEQIADKFKDKDNTFVGARLVVMGFSYNSTNVKADLIPKNWSDLTKPEFKGQLVMSDPAEAGTTMYAVSAPVNHPDYGWSYFEKLKANKMGLESGTTSTINKVGSGAYMSCIGVDYVTRTLEKQGSPIKFSYPEKDLIVVSSPIAIMKGAPHMEEAKLLYDFILSEEGQTILAKTQATPVRNGVKVGEDALDAAEIAKRMLETDDKEVAKQKQEILDKFDKLFK